MKDVCILNQNITDEFKRLDDEQYQQEYAEHCRKMNIIDSYEEEIKEVLFLSSGCIDTSSHSYQQFGLGMKTDYISLENLVDKIQHLKATKLDLDYLTYSPFGLCGFTGSEDVAWTVDYHRPDLELYRYETCSSLEEALDWYKKQDLESND